MSDSMRERGRGRKRLYKITKDEYEALQEVNQVLESIWSNLPKLNFEDQIIL